jgi:hypothetical protein
MPLEAAKGLLRSAGQRVKRAADDILYPVMDAIDRGALSPEERRKARDSDPEFRKNDDEFQEGVDRHQRRKMDEEKDEERRRTSPYRNRGMTGVRG